MANYSQMTQEDFDRHLDALVKSLYTVEELLTFDSIREVLAEELHNEVLDAWAEENPAKAFPGEEV